MFPTDPNFYKCNTPTGPVTVCLTHTLYLTTHTSFEKQLFSWHIHTNITTPHADKQEQKQQNSNACTHGMTSTFSNFQHTLYVQALYPCTILDSQSQLADCPAVIASNHMPKFPSCNNQAWQSVCICACSQQNLTLKHVQDNTHKFDLLKASPVSRTILHASKACESDSCV